MFGVESGDPVYVCWSCPKCNMIALRVQAKDKGDPSSENFLLNEIPQSDVIECLKCLVSIVKRIGETE